jgi:hypothetical protein
VRGTWGKLTNQNAQQIAPHFVRRARSAGQESPRTTKLYDRTNDAIMDGISLDEIERILI